MIKLFWNTQNQTKTNTNDKRIKEKEERDYVWGIYHKKKLRFMDLPDFRKS